MTWRPAISLTVLLDEANTVAPGRSKLSDGLIGDPAHATTASDHNPNKAGVVCALDLTHDPDNGADCNVWAEQIRMTQNPDLKYLIWAGRIFSATNQPFEWRPYTGADPHRTHIHVSVGRGPDGRSSQPYDDRFPWGLILVPTPEPPVPEDDDLQTYRIKHVHHEEVFLVSALAVRHIGPAENNWLAGPGPQHIGMLDTDDDGEYDRLLATAHHIQGQ